MDLEEKLDVLNKVAEVVRGSLRERYPVQGVYGARCYGIESTDPISCIENAAMRGVSGANYDPAGLPNIIYWPGIRSPTTSYTASSVSIEKPENTQSMTYRAPRRVGGGMRKIGSGGMRKL